MVKIIVVTIKVFFDVSIRKFQLNFLLTTVIKIAPNAPIPAASVGVAIPIIIDPKTIKIKKTGSAKVFISSMEPIFSADKLMTIFLF